ncbi:unnamed protein product [Periconia digitata]|uniref:Major facilitator superfamily (MFS) profile domain-containing protein n=1 Tax=Periconia digitata TaxID=1303443 RepID=A0A9W4U245_9PLEO|nr:unnamed protein product [Periconia digitata]
MMDDLEIQSEVQPNTDVSTATNGPLPPVDGGRDAWLVLSSCFLLRALVWGFPYGFGVFQEYYARQEQFSGQISGLAAIGTTASGIMYLMAPFVYALLQRHPTHRKTCSVVGFVIILGSFVGASFANKVSDLLATQGILFGFGGSLLYFPVFVFVDEWFVERRGLAYGALIAGDGAGGVIVPLTMEWVLNTWGFRTALRIWAIVYVILVTPALFFLKPRPANNEDQQANRTFDMRFLKSPAFWILQLGNFIQGLGYFMPLYYMPSFAASRGWPSITGTIALSLCNAAIVAGAISVGWLTDRYHVTTVINICTLGTLCAVFLFWSFSVYQPVLYIFAILYGLFAGGFPATWVGCCKPVRRRYPVETGMIIALFTAGKGVSSIISGPLSGALVEADSWRSEVGYAYGSGYGFLIVFCGVTASFASIGWIGKRLGLV